jgi:formimidoylglutamate deiminase
LRAATPGAIHRLLDAVGNVPIHIHVAEQTAEVDECFAATGARPIDWLVRHAALDARWQLVHATHSTAAEIAAVARTGAGVVLCPSTEANLGDGLADVPGWLAAGVPLSVGSDSQVTRNWPEELRLLEYGQRLHLGRRNVTAHPEHGEPATAARLHARVQAGGAAAAGFARWGLIPGARADLLVVDLADPAVLGMPADHLLDALVFNGAGRPFREVMVGGRWVVCDGVHPSAGPIGSAFVSAMRQLWPG